METYIYEPQPLSPTAVRTLVSAPVSLPATPVAAVSACAEGGVAVLVRDGGVVRAPWTHHVELRSVSPQGQSTGTNVDADRRGGFTVKAQAMGAQLIAAQRGVPPRGRPV